MIRLELLHRISATTEASSVPTWGLLLLTVSILLGGLSLLWAQKTTTENEIPCYTRRGKLGISIFFCCAVSFIVTGCNILRHHTNLTYFPDCAAPFVENSDLKREGNRLVVESREVSEGLPTPKLDISGVRYDQSSVYDEDTHVITVEVDNFTFAPERKNKEHRDGEGHLVWYLDGMQQGRVYTGFWHIHPLIAGSYSLVAVLVTNDQKVYTKNGDPICANIRLKTYGTNVANVDDYPVVASDPAPSVTMNVISNGNNELLVHAIPDRWTLKPPVVEASPKHYPGAKHVPGEGHMVLYIDGVEHSPMYSQWIELPYLSEGEHVIQLYLRSNDLRILHSGGKPVMDEVTVLVDNDSGTIQVVRDGTGHTDVPDRADSAS